jgi:hypothetical protein
MSTNLPITLAKCGVCSPGVHFRIGVMSSRAARFFVNSPATGVMKGILGLRPWVRCSKLPLPEWSLQVQSGISTNRLQIILITISP